MKTLLLVIAILAAVVVPTHPTNTSNSNDLEQWESFKIKYIKKYASKIEENKRKNIFMKKLDFVRKHNAKYDRGETTFDVEINGFADLTLEEFVAKRNGFRRKVDWASSGRVFQEPADSKLPPSVDWRQKGAVTPVKNQEGCGSCWAFSATGSLEGLSLIKTTKLVSLSEQNLVDCSRAQGNVGCSGGEMEYAFTFIKENNGIDTENSYPYTAVEDKCRYNPKTKGATDNGFILITPFSENSLKAAVANIGPISVGIDACHESFVTYKSGVYYEPWCSSEYLDHGVLAVGYGTDKTDGDYWLVKNSWGMDWGMEGYIMMSRNRNNNCGIATDASYPIV